MVGDFPIWVLVNLGILYFISESVLFGTVRMWIATGGALLRSLIYCPACLGFWLGAFQGPVNGPFQAFAWWEASIGTGLLLMAIGALWSKLFGNSAWSIEQEDDGKEA